MTQPRDPMTIPHAITRIAAVVTFPEMARIAGRSENWIRKWSAPTAKSGPTLAQALDLDAAYVARGGDGAPIFETYAHLLDLAVARETACLTQLLEDAEKASKECGEAISYTIKAARAGASIHTILLAQREVEEARTVMAVIGRRLSSFLTLRRGAGSGKTGGAHD
jgi:hypothetical protein